MDIKTTEARLKAFMWAYGVLVTTMVSASIISAVYACLDASHERKEAEVMRADARKEYDDATAKYEAAVLGYDLAIQERKQAEALLAEAASDKAAAEKTCKKKIEQFADFSRCFFWGFGSLIAATTTNNFSSLFVKI